MPWMHLIRIKCESLPQGDLLKSDGDSVAIIARSFFKKPTAVVRRNSEWHIGNVVRLGERGIGFAMGRTTAISTPQFDHRAHDFLEEEAQRAPYTIGVFDLETQVCGILRRSGVSQNAHEIAGKLAKLLNAANVAADFNSEIFADTISDPNPFLEQLHSAFAVTRFSFTVTRPNPMDVDRLIQQPAERYTEAIGGEHTKIESEGASLDKVAVEEVAKAAAAKGDEASAVIQPTAKSARRKIRISGNPLIEQVDGADSTTLLEVMLEKARAAYHRVRGPA